MKPLILILLLCFSIQSYSQCKWEKKRGTQVADANGWTTDPITSDQVRTTKSIQVVWKGTYLFFSVREIKTKSDHGYFLVVDYVDSFSECFNDSSKVYIKGGDTIVKINLHGGIMCGERLVNSGLLTDDNIKTLNTLPVELVRIHYANSIVDYKVNEKYGKNYFIETLKCFE
jgi:hypothetical protein